MSTDLEHVRVNNGQTVHIVKTYGRAAGEIGARMFCGLTVAQPGITYVEAGHTTCNGCLDSFTDPGPIIPRGFTQA